MDAEHLPERRIRFHTTQRAGLRKLLRRAENYGEPGWQRMLLHKIAWKIAWIDRQLEDLSAVDGRKAA